MRAFPFASLLVLAACSQEPAAPPADDPVAAAPSASDAAAVPGPAPSASAPAPRGDGGKAFPAGKWELVSSGEGDGLFFGASEGEPGAVHMFCAAGGGLLVNVNAFRPVGSEERMTLGSGGTTVALVADPAGDANRGGVSGEAPVPANLAAILGGQAGVAVAYGAQTVGPLPPVPAQTARAFAAGCAD